MYSPIFSSKKISLLYISGLLITVLLPFQLRGQANDDKSNQMCMKGDSLFALGEFNSCIDFYQQAGSLIKSSDLKRYIYCENKIAQCLHREGKIDESLILAEKTLSICSNQFIEQKGEIFNTIGMAYLEKGRNDKSEEYFQKALNCFTIEKTKTESKAICYTNLGLCYWTNGNNELAMEHMNQALQIRLELLGENDPSVAASYNNIGLIHSTDNPALAIEYYTKALEIYKSLYNEVHPNIAIAYNNIGFIERKSGNNLEALKNFEKALEIWLKLFNPNHPNVAFAYSNIGESYLESEQYKFAEENFLKALEIYKKNYGEKHPKIANTFNSLGSIEEKKGNFNTALENFQHAICANVSDFQEKNIYSNPFLKNYYNADLLLVSLHLKARTLESRHFSKTLKINDLKYSLQTFEVCDSLLDKIRQVRTTKNDKIELGKIGSEIYEDAISVALSLSEITLDKKLYEKKAFYFAEKNKSAVLLSAIADAKAKSFAGIPDSLLDKEKSYKDNIVYYEQKLAEGPDEEQEKRIREKLFLVHRDYDQLTKYLEIKFPNYYDLKYNINSLTVKDLQKTLDEKTALINYVLGENRNRIYIFYVSKKEFYVYNVLKEESFNKNLGKLRNAIKFNAGNAYTEYANKIYSKLIPKKIPARIQKLIIIPEGRLGNIPFEALLTKEIKPSSNLNFKDLPYLVKRFAISYDYSCALFSESVNKSRDGIKKDGSILLYAPINFSPEQNLKSLEGSALEIEKIASVFKDNNLQSSVFLHEQASEENLKTDELKKFTYLHFATHGVVDENQPELSQIFLAKNEESWEDGSLYSGEIYNLQINADLVVLSACQTGLGKIKKGEGVIGLTRALIYAGANNVIVSLWSVSDQSTSQLMIDFYTLLLRDHPDYSTALQKAKLKMIAEEKFSHPYFWAPFIFIGK